MSNSSFFSKILIKFQEDFFKYSLIVAIIIIFILLFINVFGFGSYEKTSVEYSVIDISKMSLELVLAGLFALSVVLLFLKKRDIGQNIAFIGFCLLIYECIFIILIYSLSISKLGISIASSGAEVTTTETSEKINVFYHRYGWNMFRHIMLITFSIIGMVFIIIEKVKEAKSNNNEQKQKVSKASPKPSKKEKRKKEKSKQEKLEKEEVPQEKEEVPQEKEETIQEKEETTSIKYDDDDLKALDEINKVSFDEGEEEKELKELNQETTENDSPPSEEEKRETNNE